MRPSRIIAAWLTGLWLVAWLFVAVGALADRGESRAEGLVAAARTLSMKKTWYDASYVKIGYPNGDPGPDVGVCTDIVIRAYRAIGVDLQQRVHEDMTAHFHLYPSRRVYGLKRPNSNIDHRRVTNLAAFFQRHGTTLTRSLKPGALPKWLPGDIVVFDLKGNGGTSHIGIISDRKGPDGLPLVFHHLPPYPAEDDALSFIAVSGHYRY